MLESKIKNLFTIILFFAVSLTINGQVLFSEDFNSYSIGPFPNGKNGWYATGNYNDVRIVSEPNRGNVLAWGWNVTPFGTGSIASCSQFGGILRDSVNRDLGNDVYKLEFEFYSKDLTGNLAEVFESSVGFSSSDYYFKCKVDTNESTIDALTTHQANYTKAYNHKWIKVEVYFEYFEVTDSWEINIYIPMLKYWGIQKRDTIDGGIYIGFGVYKPTISYSGALIKYDNIKLSAVPNRPAFANVNEWISSKFNVYPNPATNVVNITNNDNMLVNKVSIYDVSGKHLSTQSVNGESEIQLNIDNLANGTYILHLKTTAGMAVKKLIKK